jgi:sugar phosphate isomerase/epimerase
VAQGPATVETTSPESSPDRFCVLTSAIPGEPVQVVAERARDAGFSSIEWGVGPDQVVAPKRSDAKLLQQLAAFNGLSIAGVAVQSGPAGLDKPASIKTVAAVAAEIGAPYLRLWAPAYLGGRFADELARRRKALAEAVEITAAAGIVLLIENRPESLGPSTTLVRELIEEHPPEHVGVLWDPANGLIEGHVDPRLAVAELGPYLHHVHVKNIAWRRSEGAWSWGYAPIATGQLDWRATLAALDAGGYRGRLSIDHMPAASTLPALRRELQSLRALLGEAAVA